METEPEGPEKVKEYNKKRLVSEELFCYVPCPLFLPCGGAGASTHLETHVVAWRVLHVSPLRLFVRSEEQESWRQPSTETTY